MEILESADVVHGEGTEDAEGGHDDEPEGVAVLGFGRLEDPAGEGEREGGAVILKGVDDAGGETRHFLSSDIHRSGRADDGVGGVGSEGDEDENGAAKNNAGGGGANVAEKKNDGGKGDNDGLDEIKCHGHGGAVTLKKAIRDPAGQKRAGNGDEGHKL